MALFFADLVREACWDEGAGALALSGALPGHRTFAAVVPAGARFCYAIAGVTDPSQWETGEGEITAGTLVRTPIASSAGGAAVDFAAGLKTVALTVNAAWFEARDGAPGIGDVTGLAEALAGKAALGHGHSFAGLSDKPTTLAGYGITDAAAIGHAHDERYQPADADLTAIAGLVTTSFGRGHLTLADAAALRGHAALGSLAVQDASGVAITGGSIGGIVDLAVADGGTGASSAPAARANLGLGSSAVKDIGTSGDVVPLLGGGAASWAAGASFGGALNAAGDITLTANATYLHAKKGDGSATRIAGISGADTCYLGPIDLPLPTIINAGGGAAELGGSLSVAGALTIGATQVLGARRTGWAAPSGTASRATFDTASVTTEALAQRLKALIDDLSAHGLIGS